MTNRKVTSIRYLTESAFVLGFERYGDLFIPGQHINVGLPGEEDRPYSLYNGINDENFEILVKEVQNGNISRKLKNVKPGDIISVSEPEGYFTASEEFEKNKYFWLICTGTGISPYHCFVRSYPGMNYKIIHGISYSRESYEKETYTTGNYIACTTKDSDGDFSGRITSYLENQSPDKEACYFVCGGYDMIDNVYDKLVAKGISRDLIKSEGYF